MLATLSIRDIVLIDRLDLSFEAGLSVLTGETGAGKSILLDALALALGARGDAGLIRAGAAQGQVTAEFDLAADHPARARLDEIGVETGDDSLLLRRVQMADGRTRAYVNDQPVSAQVLKTVGALLVEIHGQHDDRALVDPAAHRALLDAYGGLDKESAATRAAWERWRALLTERDAAAERLSAVRREAEYLRHAHGELSSLAPEPGEEESLAERRQVMMAAARIAGDLKEAREALDGPDSPIPLLSALLRRIERKRAGMPALLDSVANALGTALDSLEEARAGLEAALRAAGEDPRALEAVEERLFALRAAARKYGAAAAELPTLAARFAADLAALDEGEARLVTLGAEAEAAAGEYEQAAAALSRKRRAAAAKLDKAVMAELPALKLERAVFITRIEEAAPGPEGIDSVAFWISANPGTKPGPMMRIASGGELARFILALKVVLADKGSAPTLVFDEIDTGAGGAVAEAIGLRLARLATRVQVLAVTHAPQVAARAGAHFQIAKEGRAGGRVATRIMALPPEGRREEIARMLSGAVVTEEARAHAERLIAGG